MIGITKRSRFKLRSAGALVAVSCGLAACAIFNLSDRGADPPAPLPVDPVATLEEAGIHAPILFSSDRTGNHEIYALPVDQSTAQQLTSDATFDSWWPRRSPGGDRILFYRTPRAVGDTDYVQASLWVMDGDGRNARELRPRGTDGWEIQGHAEWAPDGQRIVMFGGKRLSSQIFITDANGVGAMQVTSRGGVSLDPSWSPDGQTLLFVGCAGAICFEKDYEIFAMSPMGGGARQLTSDSARDHDPYFAPDGSRIAWLSETGPNAFGAGKGSWNIRIMEADGLNQRAVTADGQITSMPQWSPDGSRLLFHRLEPTRRREWGLFTIRPDGSGFAQILAGGPGNSWYPSF